MNFIIILLTAAFFNQIDAVSFFEGIQFNEKFSRTPENTWCPHLNYSYSLCDSNIFDQWGNTTNVINSFLLQRRTLNATDTTLMSSAKFLSKTSKYVHKFIEKQRPKLLRYLANVVKTRTELMCAACLDKSIANAEVANVPYRYKDSIWFIGTDIADEFIDDVYEESIEYYYSMSPEEQKLCVHMALKMALIKANEVFKEFEKNPSIDFSFVAELFNNITHFIEPLPYDNYAFFNGLYKCNNNTLIIENATSSSINYSSLRPATTDYYNIYYADQKNNRLPIAIGDYVYMGDHSGLSHGQTLGIVFGTLAGIALLIFIAMLIIRCINKKRYRRLIYSNVAVTTV